VGRAVELVTVAPNAVDLSPGLRRRVQEGFLRGLGKRDPAVAAHAVDLDPRGLFREREIPGQVDLGVCRRNADVAGKHGAGPLRLRGGLQGSQRRVDDVNSGHHFSLRVRQGDGAGE